MALTERINKFIFDASTASYPILLTFADELKICVLNNLSTYLLNHNGKVYVQALDIYSMGVKCSVNSIPTLELIPWSTEYKLECIKLGGLFTPRITYIDLKEYEIFKTEIYSGETRNLIQMFVNFLIKYGYFKVEVDDVVS